jgi:integrase
MSQRRDRALRGYRFLSADVDRHGNVRIYFRRKGQPKIRLHAKPGSAAFHAEYMAAFNGVALALPVTPGARGIAASDANSMRWLSQQYFASTAFQDLDQSTRRVRRRILDNINQRAGGFPFADMEPRHVAKLRDEKAATPEAANSIVKALRQVFSWACLPEYGYATRNPARDVGYLRSQNPDGHRVWSENDVAKFELRFPLGTKARLALDLFLYLGVRISDAVKLGPQMERDGKLVFNETKGQRRKAKAHELPILPPLRASIGATPTGHLVFLVTEAGHAYSVKGFGNWFARRCREAGLEPGLSAHGLRKLAATRCVEAGPPSISLWRCSAGRRQSRRRFTPGKPIVRASRPEPHRFLRRVRRTNRSATKCPTFLPRSGPVGQWAAKSLEYQSHFYSLEAGSGIEPLYEDLQSSA